MTVDTPEREEASPLDVPAPALEPAGLRTRLLRYGTVIVLVVLDLWSKAAAFARLPLSDNLVRDDHGHERLPLIGDWFAFMLSRNRGAAFGQLSEIPHILVGGRILAGILLTVMVFRTPHGRPVFSASLVLILAGALGNLYDNLFLPAPEGHPYGEVRDFIDVYFGVWDWHFPTFNVADSCITCGAVLLLLSGFLPEGRQEPRG